MTKDELMAYLHLVAQSDPPEVFLRKLMEMAAARREAEVRAAIAKAAGA